MDFSKRLKSLRKSNGITQKQLSTSIGVTERAIVAYESGKMKPAFDAINSLADYFDVSTDYLLGRTDNKNLHHVKELDEIKILSSESVGDIIFQTRTHHDETIKKLNRDVPPLEESMYYTDALVSNLTSVIVKLLAEKGVKI